MFGRRASLRAVLSFGHSDDQSGKEEPKAAPEPQGVDAQPGYAKFIKRAQRHFTKGSGSSTLRIT